MLEIYLTRHGETEWNTVKRMQGQGDSPLTELGKSQALWLGERLKGRAIVKIYASPLGRALETAEIINCIIDSTIETDDRLKEINIGPWQGERIDVIENETPKQHNNFWHHPERFSLEGIEPFSEVQSRAGAFIEDLLRQHGSGKILVVAHAIVLKALLNYVQGRDLEYFWEGKHILPTSLTKLNAMGERISVVYMSDTTHFRIQLASGWFIDEE